MKEPPAYVIETARRTAMLSPCAKSKRGVVIFDRLTAELNERTLGERWFEVHRLIADDTVLATGFNEQPPGWACTGTDICKRDCAKLCIHAEQDALADLGGHAMRGDHRQGLDLVHVKVVGESIVPGGGPSCWQCSRQIIAAKLGGVWLFEKILDGTTGRWKRYSALAFHEATLEACDLGDRRAPSEVPA